MVRATALGGSPIEARSSASGPSESLASRERHAAERAARIAERAAESRHHSPQRAMSHASIACRVSSIAIRVMAAFTFGSAACRAWYQASSAP